MTDREFNVAAKEYVDKQLSAMQRHGSAPVLSPEEYYGLISQVTEVTKRLRRKVQGIADPADRAAQEER